MILVTGAAGKTGREVIRALVKRGKGVKALVHRQDQKHVVLELGATEVVSGDLGDAHIVSRALDDVEAVYHICPNVDPLEIEYARLLMDAAISAKVARFGFHSVMHPQTEQMVHHWKKLRVEEALFKSGLAFTIIQPCAYMQNLMGQMSSMLNQGVIEVPYSAEAKLSLVDLVDVATVIAEVLCESGHAGAIYELAGPQSLSHVQIAAIFQEILGRPIEPVQIDVSEWASEAQRNGLGSYQINALSSMFLYYDRYGFAGNSNVLTHLLGRPPTTLEACVRQALET
jgi:uncharacterized protein YbjT (DUF2867 family)